MPGSNDSIIASAAADACVKVHCVSKVECTQSYNCHTQRVKRLATSPHLPYMLWSGSEDGTVRQYDLRQHHRCSNSQKDCNGILIDTTSFVGSQCEVKCIAINPLRPEQIAVGCNDPFLRLFDMRMLSAQKQRSQPSFSVFSPTASEDTSSNADAREATHAVAAGGVPGVSGCIASFCPGHLPRRYGRHPSKRLRHLVTTYAAFSPVGDEIICNLGGEHVYLFSLKDHRDCLRFSAPTNGHVHATDKKAANNLVNRTKKNEIKTYEHLLNVDCNHRGLITNGLRRRSHPTYSPQNDLHSSSDHERAMVFKQQGNDAFAAQNYFQAVTFYNHAIQLLGNNSVLFANRAAALLKRSWEGDIYAALRDCSTALLLDPTHYKAFYRQARCLYELQWYEESFTCLRAFKCRFPEQAEGYSTQRLERDIRAMLMRNGEGSSASSEDQHSGPNASAPKVSSASELHHQDDARDYDLRFVGACNTTTDIKETNFFGSTGEFIVAGSDCGCLFVWDRKSTNLVEAWHGDESIVNCLQPHPSICLLATSGIDPVVRLWSPRSRQSNDKSKRRENALESLVKANQDRMIADPLEVLLMNMGYHTSSTRETGDGGSSEEDGNTNDSAVQCRTH